MTKKRSTTRLEKGKFWGFFKRKDHREKIKVENRRFFGEISKKKVIGYIWRAGKCCFTKMPCQVV